MSGGSASKSKGALAAAVATVMGPVIDPNRAERTETRVTIFLQDHAGGELLPFALTMTDALAGDFHDIAFDFMDEVTQRTAVAYTAGRTADRAELPHLPVEDVPQLAGAVRRIEDSTPPPVFVPGDSDEGHRPRLYAASFRADRGEWTHFIRHMSPRARLTQTNKILAAFTEGIFNRLETEVVSFDQTFDGLISQGLLFMTNQAQIERGLAFVDEAGKAARLTLVTITGKLRIKNIDALLDAAATDINMISKIRGIAAKMAASTSYTDSMTMDRLLHFIGSAQLEIDIEGDPGHEAIVFHPDPPRRWRILKLLDDDYLHSELTTIDYEANSKVSRTK